MIYSYYKSNYALVLFGLPLVISLLWLGQILEGVNLESIQDSSTIFSLLKESLKYGFADQLVAMVIIVVSAVLLNSTINREEFFEKHTFLPAYTYVVVMSVFSDYQLLHPIILSNFFMVLAIRRLFHIKRASDARRMMLEILLNLSELLFWRFKKACAPRMAIKSATETLIQILTQVVEIKLKLY